MMSNKAQYKRPFQLVGVRMASESMVMFRRMLVSCGWLTQSEVTHSGVGVIPSKVTFSPSILPGEHGQPKSGLEFGGFSLHVLERDIKPVQSSALSSAQSYQNTSQKQASVVPSAVISAIILALKLTLIQMGTQSMPTLLCS